jgi:hypothetical protein
MVRTHLKAVPEKPEPLDDEVIERAARSVAWTMAHKREEMAALFVLVEAMAHNCHDWTFVENVCNTVMRELLVYTREFDEAERRFGEASRRMLIEKGGER